MASQREDQAEAKNDAKPSDTDDGRAPDVSDGARTPHGASSPFG